MRIKNLEQLKEGLKRRLPEYLKELGLEHNGKHVQCPNYEVHDHEDKGKLSAAYLPKANNTLVYCFVENRVFDIFNVYA